MIAFGGYELPRSAIAFAPATTAGLWRVDNIESLSTRYRLQSLLDGAFTIDTPITRYLTAVRVVAKHDLQPHDVAWWVSAEADQGAGAAELAAVHGACVALSNGPPIGTLGAAIANRGNVNVVVHDVATAGV